MDKDAFGCRQSVRHVAYACSLYLKFRYSLGIGSPPRPKEPQRLKMLDCSMYAFSIGQVAAQNMTR